MLTRFLLITTALAAFLAAQAPQTTQPAGSEKSKSTRVLETGSRVLQNTKPVDALQIYLVGFHPLKDQPQMQMEAHHYCHQMNEDFAQCALFDGNAENSNLTGIEYIISEKLFESLPADEKKYWHPHNYEILSGELVAPGLPSVAEKQLMQKKINSYGKTWHVWMSGMSGGANTKLPMGDPHLAWSFNRDSEIKPGMIESRDQRLKVDTAKKREERAPMAGAARPQEGVNLLREQFPNAKGRPAGVADKNDPPGQR